MYTANKLTYGAGFFCHCLGFFCLFGCVFFFFNLLNTNIVLISNKFLNANLVETIPSSEKEARAILHEVKIKERPGH